MHRNSAFRRHQQHVRGIISGTVKPTASPDDAPRAAPEGNEYAALRVLLHDNLRALADIQSHEARKPKKAEFALAYTDWIAGVLSAEPAGGGAAQDEILVTNLIWAVDYAAIDYALILAGYAIRQNLVLPQSYTRSVACFVSEDITHLSLQQQDAVSHEQLLQLANLVDGRDMPDPVMARLHKATARSFVRKADAFDPTADSAPAGGKAAYLAEALTEFERALQLDKQVGVKKDIEAVQRQIRHTIEGENP